MFKYEVDRKPVPMLCVLNVQVEKDTLKLLPVQTCLVSELELELTM